MSGIYSFRGNPASDTSFDNVWIKNTLATPNMVNQSTPNNPDNPDNQTDGIFETLTLNQEPLANNNILTSDSEGNARWSSTATLTDFTLNKGSPSSGYVLVSDSKGNASWSAPSSNGVVDDFNFKSMQCISKKNLILTQNNWTTIGTFSGSGVIKRFWLALSGTVRDVFIKITFDGDDNSEPQVGTNTTSGFNNTNCMPCDVLLGPGFDSTSTWANNTSGCNRNELNAIGGYLSFDMPFSTNFTVKLFNNNNFDVYYWSQIFFTEEIVTTPLRFHLKPYYFNSLSNSATVFNEYSLLSVESKNGVYFAGSKHFIDAGGDNQWMEGKVRIYRGGTGFEANTFNSYTEETKSDLSYYNQLPNVTQIFSSSGFEDYVLSSWNFYGPVFDNDNAGCVYNSSSNASGNKCCYRFFNTGREKCMPSAPPDTKLVVTFTCGDQNSPNSSTMNTFLGWCIYYA